MQIACKYHSLSRHRSKRSLSLGLLLSRYVFFSHSHCTCPFPSGTLCFLLSLSRLRSQSAEEKKSKPGQSKRADRGGILPHSLSIRLVRSTFNPSLKSSTAELSTDIQVFDSPRYQRIYETPYVVGVEYTGGKKNISSCTENVFLAFEWVLFESKHFNI